MGTRGSAPTLEEITPFSVFFFLKVNIASNIFVFLNFLLHDYLLLTSIFYYGFNLLWLLFGVLFHVIYIL